jgi:hypothetical protein
MRWTSALFAEEASHNRYEHDDMESSKGEGKCLLPKLGLVVIGSRYSTLAEQIKQLIQQLNKLDQLAQVQRDTSGQAAKQLA